jgi:hypothetical protein
MSTVILNLITQIAKKMMQENLAGIVEHLVRAPNPPLVFYCPSGQSVIAGDRGVTVVTQHTTACVVCKSLT